jgi:hypothetical protein
MTQVRLKIDCVIEHPGEGLPPINVLDVIEHGVKTCGATAILPGAKVSVRLTPAAARAARAASHASVDMGGVVMTKRDVQMLIKKHGTKTKVAKVLMLPSSTFKAKAKTLGL